MRRYDASWPLIGVLCIWLCQSSLGCAQTSPAHAASKRTVAAPTRQIRLSAKTVVARKAVAAIPRDISDQVAAGGLVELDVGEYIISKPCSPPFGTPLVMRGKGPGLTTVKIPGDMEFAIKLVGQLNEDSSTKSYAWWEISQLTMDGDGHVADCLHLQYTSMGRLDRVAFQDFRGSIIRGTQAWDSTVTDCHFFRSGDASTGKSVVFFDKPWDMSTPLRVVRTNCNNWTFLGCRWENNTATSFEGLDAVTKMRIISCKFHGILVPEAAICDHVRLTKAYANVITACNFANCGEDAIELNGCVSIAVTANSIAGCKGAGVKLGEKSRKNVITDNVFGIGGISATNKGTNIVGAGAFDIVTGNSE